ncbi:uncharacterized protein LOC120338308 [Styela clava]
MLSLKSIHEYQLVIVVLLLIQSFVAKGVGFRFHSQEARDHNCKAVIGSEMSVDLNGFEPHHSVKVNCTIPELRSSFTFVTVICLPICRDPITNEVFLKEEGNRAYYIEEITTVKKFQNNIRMPITLGCRCVLKSTVF